MQRITGQSQELVGFFVVCVVFLEWCPAFLDNSWKRPDEAAAGLQLVDCKGAISSYWLQLLLMVSINKIAEQAISILNQLTYPSHLVSCHQQCLVFFFFFF